MAASPSPTTRILALAVILMAAGLFSARVYNVFNQSAPLVQTQNPIEQKVTGLLETLIGEDQVQFSVRPDESGGANYLLMINEAVTFDQADVETVLQAAAGYSAQSDQLTIMQTAFKSQNIAPSFLDYAELTGLGLLLAFLVFLLRPVPSQPAPVRIEPAISQAPERFSEPPVPDQDYGEATRLASAAPERAAEVIRSWIKTDRGVS